MKLLIVTQYFFPEDFRINELVSDFVKRGHEVTVLTGRPNYPEGKIFEEYVKNKQKFNQFSGSKVIRCPIPSRGSSKISLIINYFAFIFFGTIYGLRVAKNNKFDNIFVFEPSPITVCLPAIFIKKFFRIPVTFWVLDLWPDTLEAVGILKRKTFIWKILDRLVKFIYNNCDLILGQSRGFVQEIKKYCSDDADVKFFPNWIEEVYSNPISSKTGLISDDPAILKIIFAGNIGEAQDFPTIVSAVKSASKEQKILLYVLGDGRFKENLKSLIQINDLQKNIILLGRYPITDMPTFFHEADALLVSLKSNNILDKTIPGKVQSYLNSNKPVLAVLSGEGASVIQDARSGFVSKPGHADSLASSIKNLAMLSNEERLAMGMSGYAYAQKHFNKDKILDELEFWLLQLAKRAV
jgi:glycosyltransferase involved in cell wall biosynthesis